jgi:hypothetical protein
LITIGWYDRDVSLGEFISEPIEPIAKTADPGAMARGEPGLPGRFRWRGREYIVTHVIRTWKTSTRDRGELYLRRHWHEVVTDAGRQFTLYCERQARIRHKPKQRWWIYSITPAAK